MLAAAGARRGKKQYESLIHTRAFATVPPVGSTELGEGERQMPTRTSMRTFTLAAALRHPLWLTALALLVLNDHLLKTAGVLPLAITGKLSDFEGLLVAPLVLAAILGAGSRRAWLACHVAVGAGFAAINLDPVVAHAVELVAAMGPIPWRIHVDPTDLLALPALAVSWRVLGAGLLQQTPAESSQFREIPSFTLRSGTISRGLVAVGLLACAATSQPHDGDFVSVPVAITDGPDGSADVQQAAITARLVIGNRSQASIEVHVAGLKSPITAPCTKLSQSPADTYSLGSFATPTKTTIGPNAVAKFDDAALSTGCAVFLVNGPSIPARLVRFDRSDYPAKQVPSRADVDSDRILSIWSFGGSFEWNSHPTLFAAPTK